MYSFFLLLSLAVNNGVCGVRCEEMSNQASMAVSEADRLDMLEQCASLFARLQGDYYEEYHVYELSTLAVAVVYPLVSHSHLKLERVKIVHWSVVSTTAGAVADTDLLDRQPASDTRYNLLVINVVPAANTFY